VDPGLVHMALQFTVKLDDRPWSFAELLEVLAERRVDLRSIGLTAIDEQSAVVFTTNNDDLAHKVLTDSGYTFVEGDVVITSIPDEPGALAHVASRLATANITVHGIVLLGWHQGKAELALSVDDRVAAHEALAMAFPPRTLVFR
jgi:hypothetical protein